MLYLATDKSTSQKYAIKTVPTTKKEEDLIISEIKIWEKLQNAQKPSSLPRFYGSYKDEFQSMTQKTIEYHLVFDYFPKTLQNVIDKLTNNEELFP